MSKVALLHHLLEDKTDEELLHLGKRASQETIKHFGHTIHLFTPLYLSNYCDNTCLYCAFHKNYKVKRSKLTLEELREKLAAIAETGIDDLLLLTGDSRKKSPVAYIAEAVREARKYFTTVGIEVYALRQEEYEVLYKAGVTSVTIYQETYDQERYKELHPSGPKASYSNRIKAPARAAQAGIPFVSIGALLGLGEPKEELIRLASHLESLEKAFPQVVFGVSFPRLRAIENHSFPGRPIEDRSFIHYLMAFRVAYPHVPITISTRESMTLRNLLMDYGVTRVSAGVSTAVGGDDQGTHQFEISDERSVEEMIQSIKDLGKEAIRKDWLPL